MPCCMMGQRAAPHSLDRLPGSLGHTGPSGGGRGRSDAGNGFGTGGGNGGNMEIYEKPVFITLMPVCGLLCERAGNND